MRPADLEAIRRTREERDLCRKRPESAAKPARLA